MRRYPLPPLAMWPCERPIVHVLNGDYPADDLQRMSVPSLERLVAKLVQRTSKASAKPLWWPRGLGFTYPLDLGLSSEREIKIAFKQLIVSCCQFFKANENRRRRHSDSKSEFLHYFRLRPKCDKGKEVAKAPVTTSSVKLAACVNIPFSSDVGRIMAAREHHCITEDLKMRRLERSEWYTNKEIPRCVEVEFEICAYREPYYCHRFKMPRRQFYQRRRSMRNVKFMARFCTPCSVIVERLDLDKVRSDINKVRGDNKQLLVKITDTEKMSCDLRSVVNVKLVRTSPRLREI